MSVDRLQGTDGVRRPVALATDARVAGLTPQQAFLDKGFITDQFLELYAYAFVSGLEDPAEIVIGWDPRDPAGDFTGAAVKGIRKAGATAVVVGICPTPGVALYHVWRGTDAAIMVTASHNFRDQNGVKIFTGATPRKLFPDDDRMLTDRVLALDHATDVAPKEETGGLVDAHDEAHRVFREFHLDPRNSWLPAGETLGEFPLIVDAANGAMSGVAADVLRSLHGGEVIEFNADTASGDVNKESGVADLEGVEEIERGALRFSSHRAVLELFARRGGSAAVFDGDGDRFYRLDYEPDSDRVLVLSGDETAVHQAKHLAPPAPGTLYVNTVESDLNAARACHALGYTPVLTGVGDKWVLKQATDDPEHYGIGSEETGHNISKGVVKKKSGDEAPVYLGNGLKSALNTFVATRGLSPKEAQRPFPAGFKRTFYAYYTNKGLLTQRSPVFLEMERVIQGACDLGELISQPRREEPDMLYLALFGDDGAQRAGIFVRNSGTEEKTGVNVRGTLDDADALARIGEEAVLSLARAMKNREHPMAVAEKAVLQALADGPMSAETLPVPDGVNRERLLLELASKERVIQPCTEGYQRTEFGARMLEAMS